MADGGATCENRLFRGTAEETKTIGENDVNDVVKDDVIGDVIMRNEVANCEMNMSVNLRNVLCQEMAELAEARRIRDTFPIQSCLRT